MPRLSLYKSEKGNNYKFIDHHISQMFQVGGTAVYLHKYLGPMNPAEGTADQPIYTTIKETNIQDLLFLENRDRKYDEEIYQIRGIYNVQNLDFNLSQFGLFIDNDTLFMTVHINDFISHIGRKPISGDVIELPHLKDDFALNDFDVSLPRYYVIEDVGRASEGFSATWYPHLYRLRITKITDSQQFKDILKLPVSDGSDLTIEDVLSTRSKELQINDAIISQAEADAPLSGYETRQFFTLAADVDGGTISLNTADETVMDASYSGDNIKASNVNDVPLRSGYSGYLLGDGFPVNGYVFGRGIQFPAHPAQDDFFLRIDFIPNRLFRFTGSVWAKVEDNVRMTMTNTDTRNTLKTSFINNTSFTYNDAVAVDFLSLAAEDTIISTSIDFQSALYVVIKCEVIQLEYTVEDYPSLLSSYMKNGIPKLRIALPIIDAVQQTIPFDGVWSVNLYNHRVVQRQSLSSALRPEANF